ncbi:MAG: XisH family protein [Blastocatellia bacterium]
MPARDIFHDAVRAGLENEGWVITADPFRIKLDEKIEVYIDLAAEKIIAAQKEEQKIAVEIKSFVGKSVIEDFHTALGQFLNYRAALEIHQDDHQLYLAVPVEVYRSFFWRRLPQLVIQEHNIKVIVYDPVKEVFVEWLS